MSNTSQTRHEPTYLAYLDAVVRDCDTHFDACRKANGAPPSIGLDDDLRWTGYVGDDYDSAPLRVLCAAQLHHGPMLAESGQGIQAGENCRVRAALQPEGEPRSEQSGVSGVGSGDCQVWNRCK